MYVGPERGQTSGQKQKPAWFACSQPCIPRSYCKPAFICFNEHRLEIFFNEFLNRIYRFFKSMDFQIAEPYLDMQIESNSNYGTECGHWAQLS